MKTKKCQICGRIIEGFSEKQIEYLMEMHNIKHRREKKEKELNMIKWNKKDDN